MTTFIPYNPHQGKHAPAFGNVLFLPHLPSFPAFPSSKRSQQPTGEDTIQTDERVLGAANSEHRSGPIQARRASLDSLARDCESTPKCRADNRRTPSPPQTGVQHDGSNSGSEDSDDSDLPPLATIIAKARRRPAISSSDASHPPAMPEHLVKVRGRVEGLAALNILSGYSKDQPIFLADSEMSDGSDDRDDDDLTAVTTSHDGGRITTASISANPLRSASSLSDRQASTASCGRHGIDSATNDHRHSGDQSYHDGYINAASAYNGELAQQAVRRGFDLDLPLPHNEAVEEDLDQDGVNQHAPASAGIVYDVFAEYEKRFAMGGKKRSPLSQRRPIHLAPALLATVRWMND